MLFAGKLEDDSEAGDSSSSGTRFSKSKLEDALTAKQEMEAKATTLESKVKTYEAEIAELKQKVVS